MKNCKITLFHKHVKNVKINILLFSSIILLRTVFTIFTVAFLTSILKQIDISRSNILLVLLLSSFMCRFPICKRNVAVTAEPALSVVDEIHVLYGLVERIKEILDIVFVNIVRKAFAEESSVVFRRGESDESLSSITASSVAASE